VTTKTLDEKTNFDRSVLKEKSESATTSDLERNSYPEVISVNEIKFREEFEPTFGAEI